MVDNKPVRRLSPNEERIPLKNFKVKELDSRQVIDPNLTPQEKLKLQQQLHKETFVDKAMRKAENYIDNELNKIYAQEEKDLEEKDATADEQIYQDRIAKELSRRGDKELFDPKAFGKAVERTLKKDK